MLIQQVLCVFFPAFLALWVRNLLTTKPQHAGSQITAYGVFVLLINGLALWIIIATSANTSMVFTVLFTAKYLSITIGLALALGLIVAGIESRMRIRPAARARALPSARLQSTPFAPPQDARRKKRVAGQRPATNPRSGGGK